MTGQRGYIWSLVIFTLFAVLASYPWWLDGLIVPWDAKNQFFPALRWLAACFEDGGNPFWMPEIYAGRPSLSDPQTMLLSPGYLLIAALDAEPSMLAADLLVIAELVFGGMALIVLARLRRIEPAAGVLAALIFAFGGSAMARLQHVLLVQSYAFLPIVLLAIEAAVRRPSLVRGILAGLAIGLLAIGRDHVAYLGLFVVAGYALSRWSDQPAPLEWLRRAAPALLAAMAVSAIVALPPVLATLGFAGESNRPAFDVARGGAARLPVGALLTLPVADFFGQLFDIQAYWGPGSNTWEPFLGADTSVTHLYAGGVSVVLLLWLGCAKGWLWGVGTRFAAVVMVLSLIYAVGNSTPVFAVFHSLVPGVDLFRRPVDATFIFNLAVALAVLTMADRYVTRGLAGRPGRSEWLTILFLIALYGIAVAVARNHDRFEQASGPIFLSIGLIVLIIGLLAAGGSRGETRRRWTLWALVAITAVDLAHFTIGNKLNAQDPAKYVVLERPDEDELAHAIREQVRKLEAAEGPIRVELLGFGGAWQNLSMVIGVEDTLGYNPVRNARYVSATGAKQNSNAPRRSFGAQMTGYRSPLADLLGLRLIILGLPMEKIDPASAAAFPAPQRIGRGWIYTNPRAVPRVVLIADDHARPHAPGQTEGTTALPDLDWTTDALIDGAVASDLRSSGSPGQVRIRDYQGGRLRVDLDVRRPSWLVFHELRQSGWTVVVDGKARPLVPANGLFQAVKVAPGDTHAELRFEPPWPFKGIRLGSEG